MSVMKAWRKLLLNCVDMNQSLSFKTEPIYNVRAMLLKNSWLIREPVFLSTPN